MKKKLLFLAIILLISFKGFSQTTAYPAPNISQCGDQAFDLTVQTPIILGNQDPENFTVTYYLSEADAVNNTNPIPTVLSSSGTEQIFAKVVNILDNSFDITFFSITMNPAVVVPDLADVQVCDGYILSVLPTGKYYTSPGGTGTELVPGDMISQTQTVYIYTENDFGCSDESDFLVGIIEPLTTQPEPLYVCSPNGIVDLTEIELQLMASQENILFEYYPTLFLAEEGYDAYTAAQLSNMSIDDEVTIYVRVTHYGTGCYWIVSFQAISIDCGTVSGFVSVNLDNDCETFEAADNIAVYMSHNNNVYSTYTDEGGHYSFENTPEGAIIYIPETLSSAVSPPLYTIIASENLNNQNFCITPQGNFNDVAVTLIPVIPAQSGFPASYALIYQNLGNVMQSGNITLQFDANHLNFTSAMPVMAQSGNTLTLDYTNLMPFQSKVVLVYFTVNVPQITLPGTILNFTASITPVTGDINVANNTCVVAQTVVGSYDPNDITVREGEIITEAQTDDYLNYTVRFQNTGTANAQKVRVVVALDENLDWATFEALTASDEFTVKRTDNEVEFMFTEIDLPFENDVTGTVPESNGYFIYRIKPKSSVTIGDEMSAVADIYFDFNDPITTNTVTTTVQNVAGLNENSLDSFTVYPNPASSNVNLTVLNADNGFNVTVIDMLGKTVIKDSFLTNEGSLEISDLNSGIYFISITADGKNQVKKLIVK